MLKQAYILLFKHECNILATYMHKSEVFKIGMELCIYKACICLDCLDFDRDMANDFLVMQSKILV